MGRARTPRARRAYNPAQKFPGSLRAQAGPAAHSNCERTISFGAVALGTFSRARAIRRLRPARLADSALPSRFAECECLWRRPLSAPYYNGLLAASLRAGNCRRRSIARCGFWYAPAECGCRVRGLCGKEQFRR